MNRLRYYRELRGLTQRDLADQANVSIRTIKYIEEGRSAYRQTQDRLVSALNVKIRKLFPDLEIERHERSVGRRRLHRHRRMVHERTQNSEQT